MKYNFKIYYSKSSNLPCVEIVDDESLIILKADIIECNVATFGLFSSEQESTLWTMAGLANSIIQENNKIIIK